MSQVFKKLNLKGQETLRGLNPPVRPGPERGVWKESRR